MLLRDETRLLYLWKTIDAAFVLITILAIAGACVAAGEAVRWVGWPRLRRVFEHVFVVTLAAGLMANLWHHTTRPDGYRIAQYGWEIRTLWLLLAVVVGYSWANPGFGLVRRCKQLCLILI